MAWHSDCDFINNETGLMESTGAALASDQHA
jgi:hypothetical protein